MTILCVGGFAGQGSTDDFGIFARQFVASDGFVRSTPVVEGGFAEGTIFRFVAQDSAIAKGAAGDASLLEFNIMWFYNDDGSLGESYTTDSHHWLKNTETRANYDLHTTRHAQRFHMKLRPGQSLKVQINGLSEVTLRPPGPEGITVVSTIFNGNDGTMNRFCTRFSAADGGFVKYSEKTRPRSHNRKRITAKGGVPTDCPAP